MQDFPTWVIVVGTIVWILLMLSQIAIVISGLGADTLTLVFIVLQINNSLCLTKIQLNIDWMDEIAKWGKRVTQISVTYLLLLYSLAFIAKRSEEYTTQYLPYVLGGIALSIYWEIIWVKTK